MRGRRRGIRRTERVAKLLSDRTRRARCLPGFMRRCGRRDGQGGDQQHAENSQYPLPHLNLHGARAAEGQTRGLFAVHLDQLSKPIDPDRDRSPAFRRVESNYPYINLWIGKCGGRKSLSGVLQQERASSRSLSSKAGILVNTSWATRAGAPPRVRHFALGVSIALGRRAAAPGRCAACACSAALLALLQNVEPDRQTDDEALDDQLVERRDAKQAHAIVQNADDQRADDRAADRARATG
jgi:hypothetical protein